MAFAAFKLHREISKMDDNDFAKIIIAIIVGNIAGFVLGILFIRWLFSH